MMGLKSVFSFIIIELAFVLFFVIFWASNKGFEFSDESFCVLSITQSVESSDTFYYQHIINFFLGWLNPGYVGLRLLRLVLFVFSAVVMAGALSKTLQFHETAVLFKKNTKFLLLCSICFVSIAISYSIYPQVISYNNLTEIGLSMFAAVLLIYSQKVIQQQHKQTYICSFFLGAISMLIFYCRFTSGFVLFMVTPLLLFMIRFKKIDFIMNTLKDILYFIVGIFSIVAFTSLFIYSGFEWFENMIEGLAYVPQHDVSEILLTYWDSLIYMSTSLSDARLIFPVFVLILVNSRNKLQNISKYGINLYQLFSVAFIVLLIAFNIENELIFSGIRHMSTALSFHLLMLVSVFILLFSSKSLKHIRQSFWKNSHFVVMGLLLFFIPFIGSIGTNNALHFQFLQFVFSWTILAVIVLHKVRNHIGPILGAGLITVMMVGSSSQTIHGLVYSPYRIQGTLLDQNMEIELKAGDRLLVDPKTHAAIKNFDLTMNSIKEFKKGDPMIVLMSVPGYIYLAEAGVVKNPWSNSAFPESVCHSINSSKREDLNRTIVISPRSRPVNPSIRECMKENGISFPEAYRSISSFTEPVYGMHMDLYTRVLN